MKNSRLLDRAQPGRGVATGLFLLGLLMVAGVCWPVAAQPAGRQTLSGQVPAILSQLASVGPLSRATNLELAIGLPLRNRADLSHLLRQIYDPASPNFHHYLTPEQFTERFGPTESDYQAVIAFVQAHGLKVTARHPNRVLLDVNGPVASIEKTLHVGLRLYLHPTENRMFYAPDRDPSLDLGVPVMDISGLDNYARPRPNLHATRLVSGQNGSPNTGSAVDRRSAVDSCPRPRGLSGQNASPNAGSGPSGTYLGRDFRAAYAPDTALDGSGQVVGLLQFDGYTPGDITYYETKAGLQSVRLQNVLLDGFSGNPTGDGGEVEVSLDIENSISMATNLTKVIVYEVGPTGSWHDILNRMANDNLARQLSCSWYIPGGGADAVADQIFRQMAAQGQSFFNASGDDDACTGLISFAGDSPYITQVGGTTLTTAGPGGAWVSEKVWNWGDNLGSGGGISTQYPIPSWQTNISMAANQGSTTMRNTPDVAFIADNVYVRADGVDYDVGGTSCAAPLWAGFAALINQQAAGTGQPAIGFINPAVDAIGSGPNYAAAFHDITTGNNTSSGSPNRFYAVAGYDLCTGWGTPAGQNLINALANPEPLLITPTVGFTASGGVGGPFFPVTSKNYSLTNSGTNALTWTFSNTSVWLNVSTSRGTLLPGGVASTVTVTLNNAAGNLMVGTYAATLWFTNQNDSIGQSRQFTLSVISPPSITLQPTNQAVLEGAAAAWSVQVAGGLPLVCQWQFNGTNLTDGGDISGSATTNLTISEVSAANVGTYTVVVTNFAGSVISSNAALTITPSPPVFVLQPVSQSAYVGENVQLMVAAIGTTPFAYQWSVDTSNIAGATNATLILTNVQLNQSGNYYSVQVSNVYGATNSAAATLTVLPCDPPPGRLVAWWRAEGNAYDSIGTNHGTLQGGVSFAAGEVGQAFSLDGSSRYVLVPASVSLNVGLASGFTIEGWLNPNDMSLQRTIAEWNNSGTWGAHFMLSAGSGGGISVGSLYANVLDTSGGNHYIWSAPGTIVTNQFQHVAVTSDESSGVCTLYANGVVVAQQGLGVFTPQTSYNFYLGWIVSHSGMFAGLLDEFSGYIAALSLPTKSRPFIMPAAMESAFPRRRLLLRNPLIRRWL